MNQAAPDKPAALPVRVILFTGHMLDVPGRGQDKARFPNTPEAVATARRMIETAIKEEMNEPGGVSFGIAGGACGSDIFFTRSATRSTSRHSFCWRCRWLSSRRSQSIAEGRIG